MGFTPESYQNMLLKARTLKLLQLKNIYNQSFQKLGKTEQMPQIKVETTTYQKSETSDTSSNFHLDHMKFNSKHELSDINLKIEKTKLETPIWNHSNFPFTRQPKLNIKAEPLKQTSDLKVESLKQTPLQLNDKTFIKDAPKWNPTNLTLNQHNQQPNFNLKNEQSKTLLTPSLPAEEKSTKLEVPVWNQMNISFQKQPSLEINNAAANPLLIQNNEKISMEESPNWNSISMPLQIQQAPANLDSSLRAELEKLVRFVLANMGKNNQEEIEKVRNYYINNPTLLQVYDKLIIKYYSAKKCKEDIVRYILRKAFKIMRASLMKRERINGKKASLLLCKRYFQQNMDQIEKSGVNVENEEELFDFCMPYKKNSKNKTMNTTFVLEIFSSVEFCKEYQIFLQGFGHLLFEDNEKKMRKFLNFLMDCIKNNNISKLGSFNRLPWLDVWMEDTKNIAIALMPNKRLIYNYKKPKI